MKLTVPYLLKARTVGPEKQPLLANGSEITFAVRQQILNKEIYAAVNALTPSQRGSHGNDWSTTEELLEAMFSVV
jgi:hypothetical protein